MYTVYEEMAEFETPVWNILRLQLVDLVVDLSLGIKGIGTPEDVLKSIKPVS